MGENGPGPGVFFLALMLVGFLAVAAWEYRRPWQAASPQLGGRWATNFGLWVCTHASGYAIVPVAGAVTAWCVSASPWPGLLAAGAPLWLQAVLLFVTLDAARWASHAAMHRWGWLWRIHRVHHSDEAFDVTVGVRFHPAEALLYACVTAALVALLGVHPWAVLAAEAVFITHNLFCHANARLPAHVERWLSAWMVTPDLHRVHHAEEPALYNLNFGTVLSVWDRLAGTLRRVDGADHAALGFGVQALDSTSTRSLPQLLMLPLRAERKTVPRPQNTA
jgi:sterol desaturase/sphingolipid hydroxylase (fatty acid hydroxylase superfamily)